MAGLHPGTEVHGVRIVEAHLGERTGSAVQERVVAVVIEGNVRAGRDATGQILQPFEQIGFGFDERSFGDETFGLGDGVQKRLCVHPHPFFAFQYWTAVVEFPT